MGLHRWNLLHSAWVGLGLLYAISNAISLDKYYRFDRIVEIWKETGIGNFDLSPWLRCDILDVRSYGDRMWLYSFYPRGHYHFGRITKALRENLNRNEWGRLREKQRDLKGEHREEQKRCRKEFIYDSNP